MTGVEILATEEFAVAWASWNWNNFLFVVAISFFVSVIFGVINGAVDGKRVGIIVFLSVFIIGSVLFGTIVGASTGEPTEYETQYKVIIDDTVSMNDFVDKYEIVDQDGRIYTVRERE